MRSLGEVPESFGADAEVSFWFVWHCLSHFAFHYVNHVVIWIWLCSFRDTGADNLTRHGSDPAFVEQRTRAVRACTPEKMKKHQAVGDST